MVFFANRSFFWVPMLSGLSLLGIALFYVDKASLFHAIQPEHNSYLNLFFKIITYLGDGWFAFFLSLIMLFLISCRKGLKLLAGYLLASLVVQILKHYAFSDADRPAKWFEKVQKIPAVIPEGLEPFMSHSFPSGHSATAACIFFAIALISSRPFIHFLSAFLIFLAGYSRIYLYMHFPEDVFAGIIIGLFSPILVFKYFDVWFSEEKYPKLDKALWKLIF